MQRQLGNEQFLAKAPAAVIEKMRARVAELGILQGKTRGKMAEMGGIALLGSSELQAKSGGRGRPSHTEQLATDHWQLILWIGTPAHHGDFGERVARRPGDAGCDQLCLH